MCSVALKEQGTDHGFRLSSTGKPGGVPYYYAVTDSRGGKTLTYTWSPGGRLARIEDSDGHSSSLSFDATGRLASVTAPNGETVAFTWDAGGRLIEQRLNSGQRTTQSWFEDGGLKQKQNLFNSTVLSSHLYSLDNQGRRAGQTEVIGGTSKTWSYLYDHLDRLTEANDGTAETYGYDIYGNRRSKTKGTTTAYLYDDAHQLSEVRSGSDTGTLIGAAVHDADGHMTKLCEVTTGGTVTRTSAECTATGTGATTLQLVWNALEHLNTATRTGTGAVTESYAYDDSGRRITKVGAGGTAHYLYNGEDIHAEWSGAISGNPAAAYVHGAGIDEPLLRLTGTTNNPGATQAAYLQDGLGSVVGLANPAGTLTAHQRFDAWGNKTTSSGTIPQYGYTGREPDQTGLVFYRARYYHPGIARFASRDPMGMADSVSPYAYVGNSPTNFIDPMGFMATDPVQLADASGSQSYWGIAADIGVGFTPAGVVADVYSAATGKTAFGGQELSGWERALGLIPGVSEGIAVFRGGVKGAGAVGDVLQANRAQGKAGEAIKESALRQNGTFAGKQVTFETSTGQRSVIDFVTDVPGGKGVIETKTGGGTLTSGQRQLFDDIQNGRQVIPRGKNAKGAGLDPNQPTTLRSCGIDRPCP